MLYKKFLLILSKFKIMKIKKIGKSTVVELETIEDHQEFSEFLKRKDQEKSSQEDFCKVVENDLEK